MNREEKINLIKALLIGKATLEQLKQPIQYEHLSVNELYLLVTLLQAMQAGDLEAAKAHACIDYYRIMSNARLPGGLFLKRDEEKVYEWYKSLNLKIKYFLK